ncbi:hypothetical protein [Frigoriflavimonas asaccharolytica]|uniref:Uncharacterized protein n=1 Tax=Frigoriflavimonas asaccharolytica TaxID=2735899 RepID=A0A8J8GCF1_9FLAO|nr:hypothetical protein [Frigoriflavimonas asaccharolytica]NRS93957.1 hypothetical protein [Frigoriflavimonas asaccharolytica]
MTFFAILFFVNISAQINFSGSATLYDNTQSSTVANPTSIIEKAQIIILEGGEMHNNDILTNIADVNIIEINSSPIYREGKTLAKKLQSVEENQSLEEIVSTKDVKMESTEVKVIFQEHPSKDSFQSSTKLIPVSIFTSKFVLKIVSAINYTENITIQSDKCSLKIPNYSSVAFSYSLEKANLFNRPPPNFS